MGVNTGTEALALVRRYALAIAEGRIDAKAIAGMTDDDLIAFDQEAFDKLEASQKEAEDLVTDKTEDQ